MSDTTPGMPSAHKVAGERVAIAERSTTSTQHVEGMWRVWLTRMALVAVVDFMAIVARLPQALIHAQFWAEDGVVWYAQAYNLGGARALLIPDAGYLQTYARLVAWLTAQLPLLWAPLVFNLFGIAAQMLPALILLSGRFDDLVPDGRMRIALVVLYLGLPNSAEINANLTNAQWHLALALLLVILARAPRTRWGHAFDIGLCALSGLTGPFCVFLFPLIGVAWWVQQRPRWLLRLWAVDTVCCACQAISLLFFSSGARYISLGPDLRLFAQVLGGQLALGLTIGGWGYTRVATWSLWLTGWLPWALLAALLGVVALAFRRGPWQLKVAIAFSLMQIAAAMTFNQNGSDYEGDWRALATPTWGQRYWVTPLFVLGACLLWLATRREGLRVVRWAALAALLVTVLVGIPRDWGYTPAPDQQWALHVAQFEAAPKGTPVLLPINPAGWTMTLIKR